MNVRISKAYTGQKQVGWKKTVGGREWYLASGTTPAAEQRAIAIATALEAKWMLVKVSGGDCLTETDFEEAKALVGLRPQWSAAQSPADLVPSPPAPPAKPLHLSPSLVRPTASGVESADPPAPEPNALGDHAHAHAIPRYWLYATMDEVIRHKRLALREDGSNADDILNTIARIQRSRDAVADMPMDCMRRKQIDEWLLAVRNLRSKQTGKPLSPTTIRNIVRGVRVTLSTAAQWEYWTPPPLWYAAFSPYTIKKLQSATERAAKRKRPATLSVPELRVLWRLALIPLDKALMAIAFWAGHTQNEIATLTFDHFVEEGGELFIDRPRNKTGVPGRWWIPPEAAAVIRTVVARTPTAPEENPQRRAFLINGKRLVYRRDSGKRSRVDNVRSRWNSLLAAGAHYGVRPIVFKNLRKGAAQLIRDVVGKEVSRTFLAHSDEDVQDESYTRANVERVEQVMRELYPSLSAMFNPVATGEWDALREEIQRQPGDRVLPTELAASIPAVHDPR